MSRRLINRAAVSCAVLSCLAIPGFSAASAATPLVTAPVSDAETVLLKTSMPGALSTATDAGALAAAKPMEHLQLALKRPAGLQAALDAMVTAQSNPKSPYYQHWLTPAQLRTQYGPAPSDVAATVAWMKSRGLTVNAVSPTAMSIDFSGSAAVIGDAFKTELHSFASSGEQHFSAARPASIPAALTPVISGVTLSNFFPHPLLRKGPTLSAKAAAGAVVQKIGSSYTETADGVTFYAVTPSDFATIYNTTPALSSSVLFGGNKVAGAGETIVVAEQTDINPADWTSFRTSFGLTGYAGTLAITHPGGCQDPGFTGDEVEAAIDAEWSGAVAPDAKIINAACAATETTFGVMTTLQNLVELGTPAAAISISYGGCEIGNGLTFLQMWENLVEEGASEGISIFVSSGDSASAGCDDPATLAASGLAVNGLASNPYDTAVGGTDFADTVNKANGTYFNAKNSKTGGSAKSYIPEIPWDNACSSYVNWKAAGAGGPILNCNNEPSPSPYQDVVGGSGGQSLLYAKPDWQTTAVPGVPDDGARDLPDISLFAANGFWNHFYLECMSNTKEGGVPCDFTKPANFLGSAYGGTSFAAPDFAGIAALVAQVKGGRVGNMAPRLYQIAQLQLDNAKLAKSCSGTTSAIGIGLATPSAACIFYDVNAGDISVACKAGTPNCYTNANSTKGIGILSTTPNQPTTAFPATAGYDLATGLGSVNVTNLLLNY